MKTKFIVAVMLMSLGGCGAQVALTPRDGGKMPMKPAMAAKEPSAIELMTATTQARPERSDEQLNRSEQRQDDKFDLPPND